MDIWVVEQEVEPHPCDTDFDSMCDCFALGVHHARLGLKTVPLSGRGFMGRLQAVRYVGCVCYRAGYREQRVRQYRRAHPRPTFVGFDENFLPMYRQDDFSADLDDEYLLKGNPVIHCRCRVVDDTTFYDSLGCPVAWYIRDVL